MIYNNISNEALRSFRLNTINSDFKQQRLLLLVKSIKKQYDYMKIKKCINKNSTNSSEKRDNKKFLICTFDSVSKNCIKHIKETTELSNDFSFSYKLHKSLKDMLCSKRRTENNLIFNNNNNMQ